MIKRTLLGTTLACAISLAITFVGPVHAALADKPSLVSGTNYCRGSAVNMGYGVSIQPCEATSTIRSVIETYVRVTGTATTDVRVYQAIAVVNANGTITDEPASTFSDLYTKGTSSATFAHNASDGTFDANNYGLGVHLVVDSWITNNGVRIGSVQSPAFAATQLTDIGITAYNWSGFETYGTTFTDVEGTWTAPCATGTVDDTHGYASWVGLGGDVEADLEQIGIALKPDHTYQFFSEHVPAGPITDPNNYVIRCGDVITATVSTSACTAGNWWGYILDETTGKSYTKPCGHQTTIGASTAEWIDEAPRGTNGIDHLTNFGQTNWSGLKVTSIKSGSYLRPSFYPNEQIVMQSPAPVLMARPDQSSPESAFTDRWYAAG